MSEPKAPSPEEEPLYTDERGIPMLFDVVVPGDYLKAAGVILNAAKNTAAEACAAAGGDEAAHLRERVEAAIAAALPAACEQAAAVLAEALRAEIRKALATDAAPNQPTEPTP